MFQSLFSWKLSSNTIWIYSDLAGYIVSILVFMEAVFKLQLGFVIDPFLLGFNPCFHGSCLQTTENPFPIASTISFQSLFSWKLSSNFIRISHPRPAPGVSILVFMEAVFKHNQSNGDNDQQKEFQSLFSWKLSSNRPLQAVQLYVSLVSILVFMEAVFKRGLCRPCSYMYLCFNPCFHGSCLQTLRCRLGKHVLPMFQSLFSWKLSSNPPTSVPIPGTMERFNPCFHGSCLQTP